MKMWQAVSTGSGFSGLERAMPENMIPGDFRPSQTLWDGNTLNSVYPESFAHLFSLFISGSIFPARIALLLLTLFSIPLASLLIGKSFRYGLSVFFVSGVLPYAFVFWEHGPALTFFLLAVYLYLHAAKSKKTFPLWILPIIPVVLWRQEMAVVFFCFAVAVGIYGKSLPGRRFLIVLLTVLSVTGIIFVMGPLNFLFSNLSRNFLSVGDGYFKTRMQIAGSWFVPWKNFLAVAGFTMLCCSAALKAKIFRQWRLYKTIQWIGVTGAAILLYYSVRGSIGVKSVFLLAPALVVLLARPVNASISEKAKILIAGGIYGIVAVFLLSPTDGMFQFGPRFLLAPLFLLSAGMLLAVAENFSGSVRCKKLLIITLCVLSLFASIRGLFFMRYFQDMHGDLSLSIMDLDENLIIATDEEWIPEVAWWVTMERPVLLMSSVDDVSSLDEQGYNIVWISSKTIFTGSVSAPGYRNLRFSILDSLVDFTGITPGHVSSLNPLLAF